MSVITISAACIVASLLALVLKKYNADYSLILTICSVAVVFTYIVGYLIDGFTSIKEIFESSTMSLSYLGILLKCTGVCLISEFTSDCCKDAGQQALSSLSSYGGRIFVLLISLPLFRELLGIIKELSL